MPAVCRKPGRPAPGKGDRAPLLPANGPPGRKTGEKTGGKTLPQRVAYRPARVNARFEFSAPGGEFKEKTAQVLGLRQVQHHRMVDRLPEPLQQPEGAPRIDRRLADDLPEKSVVHMV